MGLHFLAFWPCGPSFPCILALWAFISLHFGLVDLHFLAFLTLWAFISLHFGLVGLHFLAIWLFRSQLLGSPPQVAKNGPFAQRPCNEFISAVTGSILQFLALWAFISLHFGLVGLHFLAFWPCGPSFPCILALWAFISLHFGLVGLHFLAIWPFRSQLPGPPPHVAQNGPFALRPYNGFISIVAGSILQFLRCGPSFPCILALWAFIPCNFLGLQLQRNRQRADPSRCPISMCPPLDRGARGVDSPKPVKVKMWVER